jgi:hypothetical protein
MQCTLMNHLLHVVQELLDFLPLAFVSLYKGRHARVVHAAGGGGRGDQIVTIDGQWETTSRRYGSTRAVAFPGALTDVFIPRLEQPRAGSVEFRHWNGGAWGVGSGSFQLLNAYVAGADDIVLLRRCEKLPHGMGMVTHVSYTMFKGLMTLTYWTGAEQQLGSERAKRGWQRLWGITPQEQGQIDEAALNVVDYERRFISEVIRAFPKRVREVVDGWMREHGQAHGRQRLEVAMRSWLDIAIAASDMLGALVSWQALKELQAVRPTDQQAVKALLQQRVGNWVSALISYVEGEAHEEVPADEHGAEVAEAHSVLEPEVSPAGQQAERHGAGVAEAHGDVEPEVGPAGQREERQAMLLAFDAIEEDNELGIPYLGQGGFENGWQGYLGPPEFMNTPSPVYSV